jgi:hypothetical protein
LMALSVSYISSPSEMTGGTWVLTVEGEKNILKIKLIYLK